MNIREKIDARLCTLENDLKVGKHLEEGQPFVETVDRIEAVAKFWSVLSEEDRDFLHGARIAVEERRPWR